MPLKGKQWSIMSSYNTQALKLIDHLWPNFGIEPRNL